MFFKKDNVKYKQELISKAIGPSPWYYQTFPEIKAKSGRVFSWLFHGTEGEQAYLVSFGRKEEVKKTLILNTYVRPFIIHSPLLGIWFHDDNDLYFHCYDPDIMTEFSLSEIPSGFKESKNQLFSLSKPIAQFKINKFIEEGEHKIDVPKDFSIEEILIIGPYQDFKISDVIYAVYSIYPKIGKVIVYPQKWFTHEEFDTGYQWITRVLRDPETNRIIGDGIRIGSFELTADCCNLERWLNKKV